MNFATAMLESRTSCAEAQLAYLRMLVGEPARAGFLDLRWRRREGPMRRRFIPAPCLDQAADLCGALSDAHDMYIGVALRDACAHGGRRAISALQMAYIESDHPDTARRLAAFRSPPSMVIASGTPGHHQVYWRLDRPYPPAEVERANRRLALALGGDPACADAARILRPPETLNHKHAPPRPVVLLVLRERPLFALAQLAAGLPDDSAPQAGPTSTVPRRMPRNGIDRELLAIPAADYVRVLCGRSPNRQGKVLCPFHDDHDPSLQLYPDGGFYCFGSGCRAGGTIFDFASRLWGIPPRGAGFRELRRRLAECFGVRTT
ncbi:MAG TPA: DNA-primase RepB domain-containing protein [Solirubrobacteraceae bacterium]|nr:DNA-primase RepB domain-containing protein [Solirubrobacteraceae bacterium]